MLLIYGATRALHQTRSSGWFYLAIEDYLQLAVGPGYALRLTQP